MKLMYADQRGTVIVNQTTGSVFGEIGWTRHNDVMQFFRDAAVGLDVVDTPEQRPHESLPEQNPLTTSTQFYDDMATADKVLFSTYIHVYASAVLPSVQSPAATILVSVLDIADNIELGLFHLGAANTIESHSQFKRLLMRLRSEYKDNAYIRLLSADILSRGFA